LAKRIKLRYFENKKGKKSQKRTEIHYSVCFLTNGLRNDHFLGNIIESEGLTGALDDKLKGEKEKT
jgi:hypothetical protein